MIMLEGGYICPKEWEEAERLRRAFRYRGAALNERDLELLSRWEMVRPRAIERCEYDDTERCTQRGED